MFVFKVAVVGGGAEGAAIAEAIAAAGIEVVVEDGALGDVDLVIDARAERTEDADEAFAELDAATPGHAILAVGGSCAAITALGESTLRPDKVVGLHFVPGSPLVEIVRGDDTSPETVAAVLAFAQTVRRQPIVCAEAPGGVADRVFVAGLSEVWRAQEEHGLDADAADAALAETGAMPGPPLASAAALGADRVAHLAEELEAAYGERFRMPAAIDPTGGVEDVDGAALAERVWLRMFVEACLIVEDGVTTTREVDAALAAGRGFNPRRGPLPPFLRADALGLDVVLDRLEALEQAHGDRFTPPTLLRRLVAQGRLGPGAGQGVFAYPRPDDGEQLATITIETQGDVAVAWLAGGPVNAISAELLRDLATTWERVTAAGVRALVIASSSPQVFCAGADIRAFTEMDAATGAELLDVAHTLFRAFERSNVVTIAAVNGLALGGGCELAMACDVRLAAESAVLGQPEIKLGIIPGFGGTQRLPRLVGHSKALEMNLLGDPIGADEAYEYGLVNRVVPDHELHDAALAFARRLAAQAPVAVGAVKGASGRGDLDDGIAAEKAAFAAVFASSDAAEGIGAFLDKRAPTWTGS